MAYSPPNGNNINFDFTAGGYSAPAADGIGFDFGADSTGGAFSVIFSATTQASIPALVLYTVHCLAPVFSATSQAAADAGILYALNPGYRFPWAKYPGVLDPWKVCPWSFATPLDHGNSLIWEFPWQEISQTDVGVWLDWGPVAPQDAEAVAPWSRLIWRDMADRLPWCQGAALDPGFIWPWSPTEETDINVVLPWDRTAAADVSVELPWDLVAAMDLEVRLAWGEIEAVDPGIKLPWERSIPLDVSQFTPFEREYIKQRLTKEWTLPWMAAARILMNKQNISLARVSDSQTVHLVSGSVDIDVDSFCWEARFTLPSRADAEVVRPDPATGEMTEVELEANGYTWRLLVASVKENYTWAKGTYNVHAYSPSYLLGDPGPRITGTWGNQPAETVISDLLSGTDFTYTWNLLENTWNLDTGSLSVTDATWIDVIQSIPAAVGGVVQTDPAGYNLRLQSRYPVSPKNWSGATPDATLMSGILSQGIEPRPQPKYDEIIVSGKTSGVIATVRREGESGDNPAPAVVDPLLTNQAVVKERGRIELDTAGYNKADETLLLPLPGSGYSPALFLPGQLVVVADLFDTWRGQVKAVNVAFEPAKTRQQVTLERVYL
jgi:hypothetical protein